MTTNDMNASERSDRRWAIWAALVLGLLLLALGAPLAMQTQDGLRIQAERTMDARVNG